MNKKEKTVDKKENAMDKKLLLCSVFCVGFLIGIGMTKALTRVPEPQPQVKVDVLPQVPACPHMQAKGKFKYHRHEKFDFDGKRGHKPLQDRLILSDEQKELAAKIHEDSKKEIEPLWKEMKALREKMDAIRKANMEEFEKILTPEQKTKLDKMKAKVDRKMQRRFNQKFHHHHGEAGMLPPPPHDEAPKVDEAPKAE